MLSSNNAVQNNEAIVIDPVEEEKTETVVNTQADVNQNQATHPTNTTTEQNTNQSSAKTFLESHDNSKQVLLAMSIGLYDDDSNPMFDFQKIENSENPKLKKAFRKTLPTKDILVKEKIRRKAAVGDRSSTSKNGTKDGFLTWLKNHPIEDATDIAFIKEKVAIFNRAIDSYTHQAQKENQKGRNWTDSDMLRLFHCVFEKDHTRQLYVTSMRQTSRAEICGRHNEESKKEDV